MAASSRMTESSSPTSKKSTDSRKYQMRASCATCYGQILSKLWEDSLPKGTIFINRGISCGFGPDITKKFLSDNDLELLVRSHEMKDEGYEVEHDGQLITIFSAPNYCDQMRNKGAFIIFKGDTMKPNFT